MMETLVLTKQQITGLLSMEDCMETVEKVFGLYAKGIATPPAVLGIHSTNGGFHIKAGILGLNRDLFVAKINANFPQNQKQFGLPTIQGVIVVCDANDGSLLAVMDSIQITIVRTGAATGVAAKYLARSDASVVTICGCGNQGRISLKALMKVRKIEKVFANDVDSSQIEKFSGEFRGDVLIIPVDADHLSDALRQSAMVVTCTTSTKPFIKAADIMPGTFIAAVGADNEEKQELFPDLLANNKVVSDVTRQCATIGEIHHAIKLGLLSQEKVYGEIGEIIIGRKMGRESDSETIIFDSTGTALQDVAAAAIVLENAIIRGIGTRVDLNGLANRETNDLIAADVSSIIKGSK